jgi:hypothetical protein
LRGQPEPCLLIAVRAVVLAANIVAKVIWVEPNLSASRDNSFERSWTGFALRSPSSEMAVMSAMNPGALSPGYVNQTSGSRRLGSDASCETTPTRLRLWSKHASQLAAKRPLPTKFSRFTNLSNWPPERTSPSSSMQRWIARRENTNIAPFTVKGESWYRSFLLSPHASFPTMAQTAGSA